MCIIYYLLFIFTFYICMYMRARILPLNITVHLLDHAHRIHTFNLALAEVRKFVTHTALIDNTVIYGDACTHISCRILDLTRVCFTSRTIVGRFMFDRKESLNSC